MTAVRLGLMLVPALGAPTAVRGRVLVYDPHRSDGELRLEVERAVRTASPVADVSTDSMPSVARLTLDGFYRDLLGPGAYDAPAAGLHVTQRLAPHEAEYALHLVRETAKHGHAEGQSPIGSATWRLRCTLAFGQVLVVGAPVS